MLCSKLGWPLDSPPAQHHSLSQAQSLSCLCYPDLNPDLSERTCGAVSLADYLASKGWDVWTCELRGERTGPAGCFFGLAGCGAAAVVRCAVVHVAVWMLPCIARCKLDVHTAVACIKKNPVLLRPTPARRRPRHKNTCSPPALPQKPLLAAGPATKTPARRRPCHQNPCRRPNLCTGNGLSDKPQLFSVRGTQWTIDDYVEKDVPAIIRFVLKETKAAQVHFLGHSMVRRRPCGCTPHSALSCLGASIVRHSGCMRSAEVSADAAIQIAHGLCSRSIVEYGAACLR